MRARAVPGKGSQYSGADNQYVKARMKKADFNKKEWVQVTARRLRTQRHHHLCTGLSGGPLVVVKPVERHGDVVFQRQPARTLTPSGGE